MTRAVWIGMRLSCHQWSGQGGGGGGEGPSFCILQLWMWTSYCIICIRDWLDLPFGFPLLLMSAKCSRCWLGWQWRVHCYFEVWPCDRQGAQKCVYPDPVYSGWQCALVGFLYQLSVSYSICPLPSSTVDCNFHVHQGDASRLSPHTCTIKVTVNTCLTT